jgi:hypothetical protein
MTGILLALFLLGAAPASIAPGRAAPTAKAPGSVEADRTIEMHTGVAGLAYIGQPLKDLLSKLPTARSVPFAKQEDVVIVQVPEAGISCLAVGPPDDMKVASVGFNWREGHEGLAECAYRTREGIGKGSTVNDLLGTYGRPLKVTRERSTTPSQGRDARRQDPNPSGRDQYWYRNADDTVTTYFVVDGAQVERVIINHLAPLDRHVLKRVPEEAAPSPTPASQPSPSSTPVQP